MYRNLIFLQTELFIAYLQRETYGENLGVDGKLGFGILWGKFTRHKKKIFYFQESATTKRAKITVLHLQTGCHTAEKHGKTRWVVDSRRKFGKNLTERRQGWCKKGP